MSREPAGLALTMRFSSKIGLGMMLMHHLSSLYGHVWEGELPAVLHKKWGYIFHEPKILLKIENVKFFFQNFYLFLKELNHL